MLISDCISDVCSSDLPSPKDRFRAMNSLYDEFRVALHSVWTRRWLVLAVAWGICILGWRAIASIPNRYDSRARLLVDVNQILPDEAGGENGRAPCRERECQ